MCLDVWNVPHCSLNYSFTHSADKHLYVDVLNVKDGWTDR